MKNLKELNNILDGKINEIKNKYMSAYCGCNCQSNCECNMVCNCNVQVTFFKNKLSNELLIANWF